MALQLSVEEMREVCLAIAAYRQSLELRTASDSVAEAICTLEAARHKIAREWELAESRSRGCGAGE